MRIGIDARLVSGNSTGDRTYWRGLLTGLAQLGADDQYLLYVRRMPDPAEIAPLGLGENFQWRIIAGTSDRRWALLALPKAVKSDSVDLIHVQYSVSPFFTTPVATSVHDISFRLFPELFARKDRLLLNLSIPPSIRKAKAVIGVSESTRRDIISIYHTPPEKVFATLLAADESYRRFSQTECENAAATLRKKYGIDGRFVLAVGVLQPRKNLPLLVKAFKTARAMSSLTHKLVITGKRGWLTSEIDDILSSKNEPSSPLIFTGYIPDGDLSLLYNCADLFCYPSLYEGFGLPALEAMACGCPVLASNTSSLPEVVGSAGKALDPANIGAWIDSISEILSKPDLRAKMSEQGLAQASRFDWRATAEQTRAAYNFALSRAKA